MEYKFNLEDLVVKPRLIKNDGGFTSGIIYEIYREQLDKLVSVAKAIRRTEKTKNFYDVDLKIIELLQADQNFIILYLSELKEPNISFRFSGKIFSDDKKLEQKNEDVEIVVYDLIHKTNMRFAYAIYKLIDRNWERFSKSLKKGKFEKQEKKKHIESYFHERLTKYLKYEK